MPHRSIPTTGTCGPIEIGLGGTYYNLFTNRPLSPIPNPVSSAEQQRIARIYVAYEKIFEKPVSAARQEEWTPEELALLEARKARRLARKIEQEEEEELTRPAKHYVANFVLVNS